MDINKIRFVEPGNRPYKKSLKNYFVYDRYIRTPALGLITLATIAKRLVPDTYMYSEAISAVNWEDVLSSDVVFIGSFTFNTDRGYEIADYIRKNSKAKVIMGGLHPSLNYTEACHYADYVLLGEGDESVPMIIEALKADKAPDFAGVAYIKDGECIKTGEPQIPHSIETIPDRSLCHNYGKMVGHSTIWPQVHASRGCPHNCAYCALVQHYGRRVRTRSPENVVEDIKQTIAFHKKKKRLAEILWITDDNFFADRKWAVSVLNAIIDSGIKYKFTIQVRYEVGFDDEMLELLKKAGFDELSMGIEFLEDEAFEQYEKKSTYSEILRSVKNIQAHGMRVRGLFIVGADNHTVGVGKRLADFVIEHNISGVLIQSMYFIPGTPVYDTHEDKLIEGNWSRCTGKVVHYPEKISPYDLQNEIIYASSRIYSFRRLVSAVIKKRGLERILFIGEYFWQKSVRNDLKKELPWLKEISEKSGLYK